MSVKTVQLSKADMEDALRRADNNVNVACELLNVTRAKWRWFASVHNIVCGRSEKQILKHGSPREQHMARVKIIVNSILNMPGFWTLDTILFAIEDLYTDAAETITTGEVITVLRELNIDWRAEKYDYTEDKYHHSPQKIINT